MNIRRELLKGSFWTAIGRYSHYIFAFVVSAILARLLKPSDFGIVSMVLVYTGFIDLLAEFGISATVVQKRYLDHAGLSTVFWFASALALFLTGISILFAPLIELFFDFEGLRVVVQVMSINLLFVGLGTVPQGIMQQHLNFKQLAKLEIITTILSGTFGIVFAFLGWGYWALVLQNISLRFFRVVGLFLYTHWLPMFTIQWKSMRDVMGFSGNILGFRAINYWARNADNLLVGRFLGSAQLGFYNQAYKLMMYPIQMLTNIITPSIQPVFATEQDDPSKIASVYLHLLELIALITFPLGVYFSLFAGPLIRVFWGNQWNNSIPVFEVLAVLTMFQPIVSTSGSVFLARNKANLLFKLGTVNAIVMIIGIAVGLNFGIVGVATGYAISYLAIVFPLTIYFLARSLELNPGKMFSIFIKPMIIASILVPTLFVFRTIKIPGGDIGRMFGAAIITALICLGVAYLFYRDQILSTIKTIKAEYYAKK